MLSREPKFFSTAQLREIVLTLKEHLSVTTEAVAKMSTQELVVLCKKADRDLYLATLDALKLYPDLLGKVKEKEAQAVAVKPDTQDTPTETVAVKPDTQDTPTETVAVKPDTLTTAFEQQRPQQWKENLRQQAKLAYRLLAAGEVANLKEGYWEAAKQLGLHTQPKHTTTTQPQLASLRKVDPKLVRAQEAMRHALKLAEFLKEESETLRDVPETNVELRMDDPKLVRAQETLRHALKLAMYLKAESKTLRDVPETNMELRMDDVQSIHMHLLDVVAKMQQLVEGE